MIEIRSRTHTVRYLADHLSILDLFKVVRYCGYRGNLNGIPWYYVVDRRNHTCVTDLTRSLDEILAAMKSNTRNEIRRAERDGCEFVSTADSDEFIPFYNAFADSKGLCDVVDERRLSVYENLLITKTVRQGKTLAMHANVVSDDQKSALLLFSCSPRLDAGIDRKLIGFANRYLHFKDLEYLKKQGVEYYDWSGVCTDPADVRYPIGQFKLSLGGTLIESVTLKTPLYVFLEKLRTLLGRIKAKGNDESN